MNYFCCFKQEWREGPYPPPKIEAPKPRPEEKEDKEQTAKSQETDVLPPEAILLLKKKFSRRPRIKVPKITAARRPRSLPALGPKFTLKYDNTRGAPYNQSLDDVNRLINEVPPLVGPTDWQTKREPRYLLDLYLKTDSSLTEEENRARNSRFAALMPSEPVISNLVLNGPAGVKRQAEFCRKFRRDMVFSQKSWGPQLREKQRRINHHKPLYSYK